MASDYSAVNGRVGSIRSGLRIDRGLIDCAEYIRRQAPSDAVVQDSSLDKFLSWRDWPNGLLSLQGLICGSDKVKPSENLLTKSS